MNSSNPLSKANITFPLNNFLNPITSLNSSTTSKVIDKWEHSTYILVVFYSLLFLVGAPLNTYAFRQLYINLRKHSLLNSSPILLKLNVSCSDLLMMFVYLPTKIVWYSTFWWHGGSLLCKVLKFLEDLAFTSSSATVAVYALERWSHLSHPCATTGRVRRRVHYLILGGWLYSTLASFDKLIFWTTWTHDIWHQPQCATTYSIWLAQANRTIHSEAEIASQVNARDSIQMVEFVTQFVLPMLVIFMCYLRIVHLSLRCRAGAGPMRKLSSDNGVVLSRPSVDVQLSESLENAPTEIREALLQLKRSGLVSKNGMITYDERAEPLKFTTTLVEVDKNSPQTQNTPLDSDQACSFDRSQPSSSYIRTWQNPHQTNGSQSLENQTVFGADMTLQYPNSYSASETLQNRKSSTKTQTGSAKKTLKNSSIFGHLSQKRSSSLSQVRQISQTSSFNHNLNSTGSVVRPLEDFSSTSLPSLPPLFPEGASIPSEFLAFQHERTNHYKPMQTNTNGIKQATVKLCIISMLLVNVYLLCWLPYFSTAVWSKVDRTAYETHITWFRTCHSLMIVNSVINPILYRHF